MNKIILLVGLLLLGIVGSFQESPNNIRIHKLDKFTPNNQEDSILLWNKNRKLTWDDFKGVPNYNERFAAGTSASVSMNFDIYKDSITSYIKNEFEIYESWIKKDKILLPLLLEHEQGHFDISEICARRIRKEFSKYISKDYKLTTDFLSRTPREQKEISERLDSEYDIETNHGTIKDKQKEWTAKIAKMLNELEAYSSSKVVIKRVGW